MFDTFFVTSCCRAARLSAAAFASFAAVVLMTLPSVRADVYWSTSAGDWSVAANWGGLVPTGTDNAWIVNSGTATIGQLTATCGTLSLGNSAGSGTVQMTGGRFTTDGQNVGFSGMGALMQFGGNNIVYNDLYLGINAGSSGTYGLAGNGQVSVGQEYVGFSGAGTFAQSGGNNSVGSYLNLGFNSGGSGTYSLSGSGLLSASNEYVGRSGIGIFAQSGGTNDIGSLWLGFKPGGSGTYNLNGIGEMSADNETVGSSGTASFTQSGGTNIIGNTLVLGSDAGSSGNYSLSGSGQLSASKEYIAYNPGITALFKQTGGMNRVSLLSIGSGGSYLLAGGTLAVTGTLLNQGLFSGGSAPANLNASGILDLSSGTWQNMETVSVSMSANSLLIVPAEINPSTGFANYSTLGLTHTLGTTLVVPAGQGFAGSGSIIDPVICQGSITASSGGTINLSGGLTLSGSGTISLGSGNLTTNDLVSGISGGSLVAANHFVGNGGTGTFTQSGGANNIGNYPYLGSLHLGYNTGNSGTYILSGTGRISADYECVGNYGTGTFIQSSGTNSIGNGPGASALFLGLNPGSSGTYTLSGTGYLSVANYEWVGFSGTGTFTQFGGTNCGANSLFLGNNAGSSGTYNLSGIAQLSATSEWVGNGGTGTFKQSGGTNVIANSLCLGSGSAATSTYNLSGISEMSAGNETVGSSGKATFTQSGGTNRIGNSLFLGSNVGSSGTYCLSSTGQLSAASEYVGYASGATAWFQQTGGTNSVSLLSIGTGGTYLLAGGTLQVNGSVLNQGFFTGSSAPANLNASGILDLSSGTWQNMENISVSMSTNSLLIVPAEFNPSTDFATYNSLGFTHTLGTTLVVPAGQGFAGSGSIVDPVNCQGSITASSSGAITLSGGLTLSDTGTISLGSGNLTTNGHSSGISGGSLFATNHFVGNSGTGTFAQSGGTNSIRNLYLGYNTGNSGTYSLSGSGLLSSARSEYVGWSGTGTFTQSGGTNSVNDDLYLGFNAGSSGTYYLSGNGFFVIYDLAYVGYSGTGTFTQSGATNAIANNLYLGFQSGGSGTFNLNGGLLVLGSLSQGPGTAAFNFSGGTLQANNSFSTNVPMTLGNSGGGATFDSAGYVVTLSGPLSGAGGLTKMDSGTLTLATPNTYSGNTLLSGGTLALASSLALQNSTLDTSGSGALSFGLLTSVTLGGLTGPGTLGLSNTASGAVALSVGNNNADSTFSGSLSGVGSLSKIGSGTLVLSGTNTYTGGTAVTAGTLVVTNSDLFPRGASLSIGAGGTFVFDPSVATAPATGAIVAVPEPSTLALLGAGAMGLAGYTWRRRRSWRLAGTHDIRHPETRD